MTPLDIWKVVCWARKQPKLPNYEGWQREMSSCDPFKTGHFVFQYYVMILAPENQNSYNNLRNFHDILRRFGWDVEKMEPPK
jgi:hypothetical protein